MKRTFLVLTMLVGAGITLANPAEARDNRYACRDYTKSWFNNGHYETGRAQACHVGGGYWEVTDLSGPYGLRDPLREMIRLDVINLGGVQISIGTNSYAPRYPVRYQSVRYVKPPVYYQPYKTKLIYMKHKHKKQYGHQNYKHKGHDRWDHHDHHGHKKGKGHR